MLSKSLCIAIGFTAIGSFILFADASLAQQPNRLAKESSPYLLQHAHNPVDWYPWGDEALQKAKEENKMIFLSVGYAACHWCHVMERESFEDAEIAGFLNKHFVCIKVDREERPDIDQIYMTAVQLMTGRGGWPMTVLMTSDAKPLFGGSYFPARDGDRGNLPGFLPILRKAKQLWTDEQSELVNQSNRIAEAIRTAMSSVDSIAADTEINVESVKQLVVETQRRLASGFDAAHGGFGFVESNPNRPKFPEPSNLLFLLEQSKRESLTQKERDEALRMVSKSLDSMIAGGIYDHLGGGFHRYSTDRFWQIPHFEKMLYDNGQLAQVYALAFQLTGNAEYRSIAEGICDFVIRELTAPGGAFYSSLDADSEGEEGKFYRWEKSELESVQGIGGMTRFSKIYGFDAPPNFENKYCAPQPGKTLTQIASDNNSTFEELSTALKEPSIALLKLRGARERPPTDTKILTSWNGLMIAGLADTGRICNRPDFVMSATQAANFVLKELKTPEGRLLRTHAKGESKLQGYLDDYAFLSHGLLSLHRATQEVHWLEQATDLTKTQMQFFGNESNGGFFYTASDHPELLVRFQDPVDGVIPSGNSVTASNFMYLSTVANKAEFKQPLRRLLLSSYGLITKNPRAASMMSTQWGAWMDQQASPKKTD